MGPHFRVHGWRGKHRPVRGQQYGGGEIVRQPICHLGEQIGGRGRDQHEVAIARKPDMADILFVLSGKQIGENVIGGEGTDGKRRDELLGARRHDGAYARAALAQPADQVEALIGRDAAGDDEKDALSCENHG